MTITTSSSRNRANDILEFDSRTLAWGGDDLAIGASPTEWYAVPGYSTFQFQIVPEASITGYDINVYYLRDGDWVEIEAESKSLTGSYVRELSILTKMVYVRISNAAGGGAGTDDIVMYAGAK